MNKSQRGFSGIEGPLVVIFIAAIAFIGWYAIRAKDKASQTLDQAAQTSIASSKQLRYPTQVELIKAAVKDYNKIADGPSMQTDIKVQEINNQNAKGTVGNGDASTAFIAHRDGNKWTVIAQGQVLPGKDIGLKYNLPASWYSKDY